MRVTEQMMVSTALYQLRRNGRDLYRLQVMAASGQKLLEPSDDPLGTVKVMGLHSQLAEFEQYGRNIEHGLSWLGYTEAVLADLEGIISRAREIAVSQSSDTATPESRRDSAPIVRQLREQALQLANARFGNRYIFAGLKNDRPAYSQDGTFQGDEHAVQIAVGHGLRVAISLVGTEVFSFGTTDLFTELEELAQALEGDDREGIASKLDTLDQALERVIQARSEVGARVERLESSKAILEQTSLRVKERLSELSDADVAEVVTELATREVVYQASLLATRRLLESSLASMMR